MLAALQVTALENQDTLAGTVASLRAQPCSEMLLDLKPHVKSTVDDAGALNRLCVEIACKGALTDQDVMRISDASGRVQQSIASLTTGFEERKASDQNGLCEQLLNEHVLCLSVCVYGRRAVEYAQTVVADRVLTAKLHGRSDWLAHVRSTFRLDVLTSWAHIREAIKNTLTILVGFSVGYHGYMQMFPAYNASIAGTMALLAFPFASSALVKNLGRLQGVLLGMTMGQLLFGTFGVCAWWGNLGLMTSLFSITFLALFLYYNSSSLYSTLGCISAAFLAGSLLQGCLERPSHFEPRQHYNDVAGIVVGVGLLVAVDLLVPQSRVSGGAHQALVDSLQVMRKALFGLFNARESKSRLHSGSMAEAISSATFLGSEAKQEPRFWHTPWREEVFEHCLGSFHTMRVCLSCAESGNSDFGHGGALKTQALMTLSEMASFQQLPPIIVEKVDALEKLIGILTHEGSEMMEEFRKPELHKDHNSEWTTEVRRFLGEVARAGVFKGIGSATTLEHDPAAQLSVLFGAMTGIMQEVSRLRGAIIRQVVFDAKAGEAMMTPRAGASPGENPNVLRL